MFSIALPTSTTRKIYSTFGNTLLDRIFTDDDTKGRELSQYRPLADKALELLLAEVGKKTTPTKKAKAAKKAKSPKGPSKSDIKKAETRKLLIAQYNALEAGETKFAEDASNKEIRAAITALKKELKKKETAAKKDAKAKAAAKIKEQKASKKAQEKAAKKAAKGPSKRDITKKALLKELSEMDSAHTFSMDSSTKEIRAAMATLKKAAKAAAKAAIPKIDYMTPIRIANAKGTDLRNKENTNFLRVKVARVSREVVKIKPQTWTDEANARFDELYPNGKALAKEPKKKTAKKTKALKKATAPKKSDLDLIAQLATDAAKAELAESKPVSSKAQDNTDAPQEHDNDELTTDDLSEIDDDELTTDDLSEIDDDSDIDDDEPEFPGEDEVEEFQHSLCPGQQLYLDEEHNVFNDEQVFIGKYDAETDTIEEA